MWLGDREREPVLGVEGDEQLDQALAQILGSGHVVTDPDVEIFGQSRTVTQTGLHRHAALDDPLPRLTALQACDDTLEDQPAAEPIERYAGLLGEVSEPRLDRHP